MTIVGILRHRRDDRGASLVLALAVMLAISTVLAGVLALVSTSFRASAALEQARNRQYAADAAVEQAIRFVQTDPGLVATNRALLGTSCGSVTTFVPSPTVINGHAVRVSCQGQPELVQDGTGNFALQRNVVFTACIDTGAPCTDATALLKTKVNFPTNAAGQVVGAFIQSWSVKR